MSQRHGAGVAIPLLLGCVVAVLAAARGAGLTYNTTGSLPAGLYRVLALDGDPERHAVVGVCLDEPAAGFALARGYVHRAGLERWIYGSDCRSPAAVIGKPVAGIPGDTIDIAPDAVWVNGVRLPRSQTPAEDAAGRPITPYRSGRIVLGPSQYWLQSPHSPRSFDSRILGPIPRDRLIDRRVLLRLGPARHLTHRASRPGPERRVRP